MHEETSVPLTVVNVTTLALYRAFDEDHVFLYIGKTDDMRLRMVGHSTASRWWVEFTYLKVERGFATEAALQTAEELAICSERPLYNRIFNNRMEP